MSITLTAIPGGTTTTRKALEDIDPDVIAAVEDALKYCENTPSDRVEAGFASQDDADAFLADARAYAYQRPAGRLVVSGNTTKKGFARFRVLPYVGTDAGTGATEEG